MARITTTEERRGAILDGRARETTHSAVRLSVQRVLSNARIHARLIAPVLTGRYRASLVYETHLTPYGAEGTLSSSDNPAKVGVIEYGYNPSGPRGHWHRVPRLVFTGTTTHAERLIREEARNLEVELVGRLSR